MTSRRILTEAVRARLFGTRRPAPAPARPKARLSLAQVEDRNAPGSLFNPADPLADLLAAPAPSTAAATAAAEPVPTALPGGNADASAPALAVTSQAPTTAGATSDGGGTAGQPTRATDPLADDLLWDPAAAPTAIYVGDPVPPLLATAQSSGGDAGAPAAPTLAAAPTDAATTDATGTGTGVGTAYYSGSGSGSGFGSTSGSGSGGGSMVSFAVGDRVWNDANRNGAQDGEAGMAGVTVRLLDAGGNTLDTRTTGTDGGYQFVRSAAPNAQLRVKVDIPAGYAATEQYNVGVGTASDSNIDATGLSGPVTVPAVSGSDLTIDAGLVTAGGGGFIGDRVWRDADGDGLQDDAPNLGVPGVTVQLLDGTGSLRTTATTGTNGDYGFPGLPAGAYTVRFTAPAGYSLTTPTSVPVSLSTGQTRTDVDAGLYGGPSAVWIEPSEYATDGVEPDPELVLEADPAGTSFVLRRDLGYSASLSVSLNPSGTAGWGSSPGSPGIDYTLTADGVMLSSPTVTFAAGQAAILLTLVPVNDGAAEPDESATVAIGAGAGYRVGTPNVRSFVVAAAAPPTDLTKVTTVKVETTHIVTQEVRYLTPEVATNVKAKADQKIQFRISGGHTVRGWSLTATEKVTPKGMPEVTIKMTLTPAYSEQDAAKRKTAPYRVTFNGTSDYNANPLEPDPKGANVKTMYPDNWTNANITTNVEAAFKDAVTTGGAKEVPAGGGRGTFVGKSGGITIEGYWKLDRADKTNATVIITTAAPKIP